MITTAQPISPAAKREAQELYLLLRDCGDPTGLDRDWAVRARLMLKRIKRDLGFEAKWAPKADVERITPAEQAFQPAHQAICTAHQGKRGEPFASRLMTVRTNEH